MIKAFFAVCLTFATFAVAACSDSKDDNNGTSGTPTTSGGGTVGCKTDPRVTPYAAGLKAQSATGKFTAEIMNAEPAPPQKGAGDAGMNVWTLKLLLDGNVVDAVTPSTLMPDHGHGSPRPIILAKNEDGTWNAQQVFFFMAGVWEITFAPTSAPTEKATFRLCLE